jgi:hypothetical protein
VLVPGEIMAGHLKATFLSFAMSMPLLLAPIGAAQQKKPAQAPPAPIPAQIPAAKKVFIANGGGDEARYDDPLYSGGPDRPYNEFYAAMKSSGRFELVATPADADLVFEIRLTVFRLQRGRVLSDDAPTSDSQFRLVIRDPRTRQTLWALSEHAQVAVLQGNRDKNFEQALTAIVAEVNHSPTSRGPRQQLARIFAESFKRAGRIAKNRKCTQRDSYLSSV